MLENGNLEKTKSKQQFSQYLNSYLSTDINTFISLIKIGPNVDVFIFA